MRRQLKRMPLGGEPATTAPLEQDEADGELVEEPRAERAMGCKTDDKLPLGGGLANGLPSGPQAE